MTRILDYRVDVWVVKASDGAVTCAWRLVNLALGSVCTQGDGYASAASAQQAGYDALAAGLH